MTMEKLPWYFFGEVDCLFRGDGERSDRLLERLGGADLQAVIGADGTGGPPGLLPIVSDIVGSQSQSTDRPEYLRWSPGEWPEGWRLRVFDPEKTEADQVILEPGVISLPWPPKGGEGLELEARAWSAATDPAKAVRYGDALLQAADNLMVTDEGRALVQGAASQHGGSVGRVDVLPLLALWDPDLAKGGSKALPTSFTCAFNEEMLTVGMWVGVNAYGGVHLELGWKREEPFLTRDYPCGDPGGG